MVIRWRHPGARRNGKSVIALYSQKYQTWRGSNWGPHIPGNLVGCLNQWFGSQARIPVLTSDMNLLASYRNAKSTIFGWLEIDEVYFHALMWLLGGQISWNAIAKYHDLQPSSALGYNQNLRTDFWIRDSIPPPPSLTNMFNFGPFWSNHATTVMSSRRSMTSSWFWRSSMIFNVDMH